MSIAQCRTKVNIGRDCQVSKISDFNAIPILKENFKPKLPLYKQDVGLHKYWKTGKKSMDQRSYALCLENQLQAIT